MAFDSAEDNVKRGGVAVNDQLKKARQRGERDKAGNHAGAVDGKAFEPLPEIVALRAEDEELVGKVGDGDGQRQGQYGRQHNREVQEAGRQNSVEQRKNDGEAEVAKKGIEYPDTEVTGKLAAGEATDQAIEPLPGKEGVLWNRYNRWMLRVNLVAGRGRLLHVSASMAAAPDFDSHVRAKARRIDSRNGDGRDIWVQRPDGARLLTQPRQYVERLDPSRVFCNTFNFGIDNLESGALQEGGHGVGIEEIQVLMALYETGRRNMVQPYACRGGVEIHGDQSRRKMQQSIEVTAVKPAFSRKADPIALIGNGDAKERSGV